MDNVFQPEMQAALLTRPAGDRIGKKEVQQAGEILTRYKEGKANLENRIVEDELWWQLRHWEAIGKRTGRNPESPQPSSAWLFNAIVNKHADAMDNYPEPIVLPREMSDDESAKTLSSILPVIMECNDFEQVYSDAWWEKLKHGTACYGVFWDKTLENGLGDVNVKTVDLLKIFWEPGITDIQKSRNLFIVDLVDTDQLEQQYPEYKGKLGAGTIDVKQYQYDDTVDTSDKSVVVDWYYKIMNAAGKTTVHYCKFINDIVLYASENDPEYSERGYYDHGEYPVVFDTLYPEKGSPVGFGYVSICKEPQMYIDKLSANILESSMMATKKRFLVSANTNINSDELLDWNNPLVHVEGELDDRRVREFTVEPLSGIYIDVLAQKIEEMKDTASNRDVNSGGSAGSGVTAAAAIAALQEAGNKSSRDMIPASYRAHAAISSLVIELMRQFYDETRSFRITGKIPGQYEFVDFSNAGIQDQVTGVDAMGNELYRRPIFDLKIKAAKKNPFSRAAQNEYAKELYSMGFFQPENAQNAMGALDMMEFEGIDKVKEYVQQGQTLLNMVQQLNMRLQQCVEIMQGAGLLPPGDMGMGEPQQSNAAPQQQGGSGHSIGSAISDATTAGTTSYGERLAKRSTPDMSGTGGG